jgi:hypothetical protein
MLNHLSWGLNMGGLVISFVGSALLFAGSTRDTPDIPQREPKSIEMYFYYKDHDVNAEFKKVQKRQKRSKCGFLLVTIGFSLQIISQVL